MYTLWDVNSNSVKLQGKIKNKQNEKGALNNQFPLPFLINKLLQTNTKNVDNFKKEET